MLSGPAQAGLLDGEDWSRLADTDVVILGEVHDNPEHHANQAAAVAALQPAAIVFEQLTPALAARVTPENRENAEELSALLDWDARGWPDFAMYHPIFMAAPEARILGGGAPIENVRSAMTIGAAAAFDGDADIFDLATPFPDAAQADLEAAQAVAHCNKLPEDLLPGMVAAQRFRDATLAGAALDGLAHGPVVVITGNGHATNDWAVPAMVRTARPDISVQSVGQFEETAPADPDFDYWLITASVDRGDPCDAFR